ncbi:MAG: hypothetical protein REI96_01100 [Flavobacterium nitrogenifigens]|uniref:hypothetical protein n=1 Tax=Flavobacterium nitrogenifigens TaxID=1617283 RepID=UPI0028084221|nr:hypothetical protein [Flavobacterium nitrogenifigens]MDQ8011015.1 hypothetical protein [Flavobacterium nitrogenifigens]
MRLPSSNFAEKIDFEVLEMLVFKTPVYSQQARNVGNEIQALILASSAWGAFPDFS